MLCISHNPLLPYANCFSAFGGFGHHQMMGGEVDKVLTIGIACQQKNNVGGSHFHMGWKNDSGDVVDEGIVSTE
jgi:hypothetical protein